ncbi:uncharacterized protein LOC119077759 [Bradysia coprophila]|uniref:uncharacterized protein LOC119077759 n=1 Tax=Bradysia coprophila TaxID=38358 RepID=UPI00187D89FC|nr:uncharacterized protein LOC119077759 [Bradysia coprophila]
MENISIESVPARTGQIVNSSAESHNSISKNTDNHHLAEEPVPKKLRCRKSIARSSIVLRSTHKVTSLPYLPTEIVEMILCNVSTSNLLNCRLVSWHWNAISCRIIRGRDDISVHLALVGGKYVHIMQHRHTSTANYTLGPRSLADLVVCLEESTLFPFTSFRFDGMSTKSFGLEDLRQFIKTWGSSVRSIRVNLPEFENVEILQILLFEKFPNLKKLRFLLELT